MWLIGIINLLGFEIWELESLRFGIYARINGPSVVES